MMVRVVLALGSNLGDRFGNLRAALDQLETGGVAVGAVSSAWETAPVPPGQPPFLNAALVGETDLAPEALLDLAKAIEQALGRRPSRRWGPRTIDVDILFHGDGAHRSERLTIPHPLIAERSFVLAPLSEVLPGPLPVLGRAALEFLAETGVAGLRRLGPLRA
jgi:2-amino-4-hydroxy-6-hydroxymethyldihydropteridine diphosphokinase